MDVTLDTISEAEFTERFRCYDPEDVDQFLARVARQLTALARSGDLSS